MRPGRKPKPTPLKRLGGNAGKRALPKNEPAPPADDSMLAAPAWLDPVAAGEWRRIAPHLLTLGLLTLVDEPTLAAYCKAYSRWRKAEQDLDKEGLVAKVGRGGYKQQQPKVAIALRYLHQMHALAAEFGFTPASRTRVMGGGEGEPKDPYSDFLKDSPSRLRAAKAAVKQLPGGHA